MACVANAKQFGFILGLVAAAAASEIFGHGQISLKMEEGNPHRGFQVRPHQEMKREEEATSTTATDAEDASVLELGRRLLSYHQLQLDWLDLFQSKDTL